MATCAHKVLTVSAVRCGDTDPPDLLGDRDRKERKKHIKKETRKQNFHGIVPGFWGKFVYVFFLTHKE